MNGASLVGAPVMTSMIAAASLNLTDDDDRRRLKCRTPRGRTAVHGHVPSGSSDLGQQRERQWRDLLGGDDGGGREADREADHGSAVA